MEKVKKQHYVPRFYLKKFTYDGVHFDVYDKESHHIMHKQNAENFAYSKYYYDIDKAELIQGLHELLTFYPGFSYKPLINDEQFIEHFFGRVETDAAQVLRMIEKNPEELFNESNLPILLVFIVTLAQRTDYYRQTAEGICKKRIESLRNLGLSDQKIEQVIKSNGLYSNGKSAQIDSILGVKSNAKLFYALLSMFDCYYAEIKGNSSFLISDNPAYEFNLLFKDLCFPINSKIAIIYRAKDLASPIVNNEKKIGNRIFLSNESVLFYNAMQYSSAQRFVFGEKQMIQCIEPLDAYYQHTLKVAKNKKG